MMDRFAPMPPEMDHAVAQEPRRILLVEDSPTQALRLQLLLEDEGYLVDHAESAEMAVPVLNRLLPHLLIIDHHLPGLQGADLCRLVRLHVATLSMPILMLTADETAARQQEGLDSGADDFVSKSIDPALLLLHVAQLLRHSRRDSDLDVLPQPHFRQPRTLKVGFPPDQAMVIRRVLVDEGCEVETLPTGAAALAAFAAAPYDLVLVAAQLPDMTGLELCQRCDRTAANAPALLLAHHGEVDQKALQRLLTTGIDDLFRLDAPSPLRARLRAILRRRFMDEQNRRLLAAAREQEGRALRLEAERNAAQTRAQLADQLALANRRLADQALITTTITRNVPSGLILVDGEGEPSYLNPPATAMLGTDISQGCLFHRLGLDFKPGDPIPAAASRAATLTATGRQAIPVIFSVTPLDGDNGPTGAVVQIIDVTERRRAEERQSLLMAELSHRVKNTMATVLSIGSQTKRRYAETERFWQSFEGRLRALSETHNLLADNYWEWVALEPLIRHEVKPYAQEPQDILLEGPHIEMRPKAALALALVFHELATNAAKYGAFTQAGGHLAVTWDIVRRNAADELHIEWQESNVTLGATPGPDGFGSTLIQRSVAYELQGQSTLTIHTGGLRCRMSFPLNDTIRRRMSV